MNENRLAGMDGCGVCLSLEVANSAGWNDKALGVNEEWLDGGDGDVYGEEVAGFEPADQGVGGGRNFIGNGNGKLAKTVDDVDGTFDEVLLGCIQGLEFLEFERSIRVQEGVHAGNLAGGGTVVWSARAKVRGNRTLVKERTRSNGGGKNAARGRANGYGAAIDTDDAGEILDEFELIRTEIGIRAGQREGREDARVGSSGVEIDRQSSAREGDGIIQVEVDLDSLQTARSCVERERADRGRAGGREGSSADRIAQTWHAVCRDG